MKKGAFLIILFCFVLVSALDCTEKCLDEGYYSGYCTDSCSEGEIEEKAVCSNQGLVSLVVSRFC